MGPFSAVCGWPCCAFCVCPGCASGRLFRGPPLPVSARPLRPWPPCPGAPSVAPRQYSGRPFGPFYGAAARPLGAAWAAVSRARAVGGAAPRGRGGPSVRITARARRRARRGLYVCFSLCSGSASPTPPPPPRPAQARGRRAARVAAVRPGLQVKAARLVGKGEPILLDDRMLLGLCTVHLESSTRWLLHHDGGPVAQPIELLFAATTAQPVTPDLACVTVYHRQVILALSATMLQAPFNGLHGLGHINTKVDYHCGILLKSQF